MVDLARVVSFSLHPHENADRLSIAKVDGTEWQCVTATAQWAGRDLRGIYIGVDALLDPSRDVFFFLKDKASKQFQDGRPAHRIRTIRLRGKLSQGLLVPIPADIDPAGDITAQLGIERYEPAIPLGLQGDMIRCPGSFERYPHIENAKNFPTMFVAGDMVSISEKIHGTSFRVGLVDDGRDVPVYIVGTHATARATDGTNLYSRAARSNVPEEKLREVVRDIPFSRNFAVYGELFGWKVQDLSYGCSPGTQRVRLFDVMIDDVWQSLDVVLHVANKLGLETVPVLHEGPFDYDKIMSLRDGKTTLQNADHVREGVVVRSIPETHVTLCDGDLKAYSGRKMLKYISDAYLERRDAKDGH